MISKCIILITIGLLAYTGCATPPPVKQALVDIDNGYLENLKLMQQYRQLVENINEMHHSWYRYTHQRLLLDLTLKSITQDQWGNDATKVDITVELLGDDLLGVVNELRFPGLTAQRDSKGIVKFEAGKPHNNAVKMVERLPEIVNRVVEKGDKDYKKIITGDMSHFDVYFTNVSELRQINGSIKRYLNIDVTITPKDVAAIANSIRQLRQ